MPQNERPVDVVILGAGVIGLTIALELTNTQPHLRLAIVAKDLPSDIHSTGFASPWAGCNWCSFAPRRDGPGGSDAAAEQERQFDAVTYKRLGKLAKEHPDLCQLIPFYDVWGKDSGKGKDDERPWFAEEGLVKDSRIPGGNTHGITYSSYIINAPAYINHLYQTLKSCGVIFVRARLMSLHQAYDLPALGLGNNGRARVVVNATGLGAKSLIGVLDKDVYPIRGQTILARAPHVKTCYMQTPSKLAGDAAPQPIYIIPRPGPDGHVILGGTFMPDNFDTLVDHNDNKRILKGCYALCPELSNGKGWESIEIVNTQVGLRPSRKGGARVEVQTFDNNHQVVHAYGFGPAGYQNSMGAAEKAACLVMQALRTSKL